MKLKLAAMFAIAAIALTSNVALASKSNQAYTACKSHIAELHDGAAKTTLKKIKKKKGKIEVRVKVRNAGEAYGAKCVIDRDGGLAYTTSQSAESIARN